MPEVGFADMWDARVTSRRRFAYPALAGAGKTRITIRLDDEIVRWFRDQVTRIGGGNYQTLINEALQEYIHQKKEPLEETVRRVIREELERVS